MIIKQGLEAEYRQFLEVNSRDGYSFAAVQCMGRWADLMETEMASGAALPDIAERTSHQADTDLITGFQYGCAVSALAQFWVHGDELRQWHNQRYSYEGPGEVNPAMPTILME